MTRALRTVALLGFTLTVAACGSTDLLAPDDVAGTYLLQSVTGLDGSEPSVGLLRLMPDGAAERRLTFVRADGENEIVWHGRYRVRGGALELAFWSVGTTSGELFYRTVPHAPDLVVLRYGRPAGGDVIEVYGR